MSKWAKKGWTCSAQMSNWLGGWAADTKLSASPCHKVTIIFAIQDSPRDFPKSPMTGSLVAGLWPLKKWIPEVSYDLQGFATLTWECCISGRYHLDIPKYIILMSSRNPVKHMSRYLMCCRCMFKETVLVIIILLLSSTYRDIDTLLFSVATGKSKPNFADDHDSARVSIVVTGTCYTAFRKHQQLGSLSLKPPVVNISMFSETTAVHGRSFRQGGQR